MVDSELDTGSNTDVFGELFHWLLLEGIGVLFTLAAFAFIVLASIKLLRGDDIPGARAIFWAMVVTFAGALMSAIYTHVLDVEENIYIEASFSIVLGAAFLGGALGFWRLAKYVASMGANPPLNRTRADSARTG
jgi:hypothetical protein